MYYKLNSNYMLRGWSRLPYAIVDRQRRVEFIPAAYFDVLQLVAGGIEDTSVLFSDEQRGYIRQMQQAGVLQECPGCKEPTRPDASQAYRCYPSRFIDSVLWSVTGRCNYRCKHCYMSAPKAKYGELPTEDCLRIVDQLAECGVLKVSLTGGEVLVRKDFWQILDALLAKGLLVTVIYSNGKLVTEEFLDGLKQRGICPEINISFDGVGCHDWMRGVEGAEKEAIRAFRLCKEKGFPTGAEFCLYRGNRNTLRESVNLLASLGVRSLKVSPVMEVGEWCTMTPDMTLLGEEVYETYLDYIPHYIQDGSPLELMLSEFFAMSDKEHYLIPARKQVPSDYCGKYCLCGHARTNLYITADGRMMPCMPLSGNPEIAQKFPKILELPLKDALENSFYMSCIETKLSEFLAHNPKCMACEYRYDCAAGCRGRGAKPEDYLAIDQEMCNLYHSGYIQRVDDLMKRYKIKNAQE